MRALIYLVIGVAILAGALFWYFQVEFSVAGLVASIAMGVGGAFIVAAIAVALDKVSPTSRKI